MNRGGRTWRRKTSSLIHTLVIQAFRCSGRQANRGKLNIITFLRAASQLRYIRNFYSRLVHYIKRSSESVHRASNNCRFVMVIWPKFDGAFTLIWYGLVARRTPMPSQVWSRIHILLPFLSFFFLTAHFMDWFSTLLSSLDRQSPRPDLLRRLKNRSSFNSSLPTPSTLK